MDGVSIEKGTLQLRLEIGKGWVPYATWKTIREPLNKYVLVKTRIITYNKDGPREGVDLSSYSRPLF